MKTTRSNTPTASAESIRRFVERELQPLIREDGGNVEFESVDGRVVSLRMGAACATCPSRERTVREFIEPRLRARFGKSWSVRATVQRPYFSL